MVYRSVFSAFFMDLPVPCHSYLLIVKGVDLAVAHDRLPFKTEVVRIFHSGCTGAFQVVQAVLDSYKKSAHHKQVA